VKNEIRARLKKLEAGKIQLNSRHGNPIVGHPVLAELANTAEEVCALIQQERKRQKARGPDSRELLACVEKGFNALASARDALALGDTLDATAIDELRGDIQRSVDSFKQQSIACTLAAQSRTEQGKLSEQAASDAYEEKVYERIKGMLSVYAPMGAMLPNANSVKYQKQLVAFAVLPVIAVFGSFSKQVLQSAGFKIDLVADYPVLQDQRVLGINIKRLAKLELDRDQVVEGALEQISKRLNTKYALVFEEPASSQNGFQYFWIMPDRLLSKLVQVTHGGAHGWSFPFKLH
jgi:hypothetical protein